MWTYGPEFLNLSERRMNFFGPVGQASAHPSVWTTGSCPTFLRRVVSGGNLEVSPVRSEKMVAQRGFAANEMDESRMWQAVSLRRTVSPPENRRGAKIWMVSSTGLSPVTAGLESPAAAKIVRPTIALRRYFFFVHESVMCPSVISLLFSSQEYSRSSWPGCIKTKTRVFFHGLVYILGSSAVISYWM